MYNKLLKSGTTYAMMLGVILIFIFGAGIFAGGTTVNADGVEVVEVGVGLQITIALTIIAMLAMIIGIIMDIAQAGKKGLKAILGFVVLLVLFSILQASVTVEKGGKWDVLHKEYMVSDFASSFVSAGLYTCGALLVVTVIVFVYSEVRSFFS
ncbi:MAG: hypothetical protein IPN79_07975 [Saprospiraceae bacterium]|nr:hypothetical protein [Saprospiraceae bacterium]